MPTEAAKEEEEDEDEEGLETLSATLDAGGWRGMGEGWPAAAAARPPPTPRAERDDGAPVHAAGLHGAVVVVVAPRPPPPPPPLGDSAILPLLFFQDARRPQRAVRGRRRLDPRSVCFGWWDGRCEPV